MNRDQHKGKLSVLATDLIREAGHTARTFVPGGEEVYIDPCGGEDRVVEFKFACGESPLAVIYRAETDAPRQLYRIWAKFEGDHENPLTGRQGQWRVTFCQPVTRVRKPVALTLYDEIAFTSTKPHQLGSIVRPHKEHLKVFERSE